MVKKIKKGEETKMFRLLAILAILAPKPSFGPRVHLHDSLLAFAVGTMRIHLQLLIAGVLERGSASSRMLNHQFEETSEGISYVYTVYNIGNICYTSFII